MTETNMGRDLTQRGGWLKRYLLPVAILVGAVLVGVALIRSRPTARRTPPVRAAKLVEVEPIRLGDRGIVIEGMGTVMPAREVTLIARVSGQIVEVSPEFVPGGFFREGEVMVRIDPRDYALLVQQRESALAQAESAHRLEMGQQTIARREYELLSETIAEEDRDLVLRKPQLQSAAASVAAARAALEDARLDLERTEVRAPFKAVLSAQMADVGGQVSTASPVGRLVGTDLYWVEVSVPVDQLRWIAIPRTAAEKGAQVRIYSESAWGEGVFRSGSVIRMRPGLEEQGRMARLLIEVADPLALRAEGADVPRMILATYVRVEIEGAPLQNVATISRSVLRDGDCVYLMDGDGQLEIRPVEILFRGPEAVFVRGVNAGERLVTTDLSAPVEGMPLRVQGDEAAVASERKEGAS